MSAKEQQLENIPDMREENVYEDPNNITWSNDLADCVTTKKRSHYKNIVHLWEFLLELLADDSCRSLIVWSRQAHGEFKLKDQEEVAKRWGRLKCRPKMNYEKLSRALRHYYTQGIIKKVPGQRLVYKFHKLPYKYTPGKATLGEAKALATFSALDKEERHEERAIYSEHETPTNRDKLKTRLLQQRETRATNIPDTPNNSKRNDTAGRQDGREFMSDKLPSAMLFPSGGASPYAGFRRGYVQTQILYPVSAFQRFRPYGWSICQANSAVPVSVIARPYDQ